MRVRSRSLLLGLLGLAVLFAAGLAVRRAVLNAQMDRYGRPLPFTLESALEYRYVRLLAETGRLPDHDDKVQVPEGISVRRTYTIGAEFLYAAVAAWLPRALPLDERVRWTAAAWFCLGIPLLSLWMWAWLRSRWAAGLAGAYYAVSIGSVMRSTGQELQHEQFAMPWLIGHLACAAWARRARGRPAWLAAAGLSAVLLGAAVAAWDLMQYAVLVWAVAGYLRFSLAPAFRRQPAGAAAPDRRDRAAWTLCLAALLGAGWLNPYLRAHGCVASHAMLLAYGTLAGLLADAWRARTGRPAGGAWAWARLLAPLALVLAGGLWARTYADSYGHFMALLAAKLRFLNHKPANPALLTFDQRILWTPPLNSVSPGLTWMLFPATLPLSLLAGAIAFARSRRHPDPDIHQLLGFTILSLLAFVLFMRFHVFLSVGASALLGWLGAWAAGRRTAARWAVLVLLLAGLGVETAHTLVRPLRWGSVPRYLEEQKALVHWLRTHTRSERIRAASRSWPISGSARPCWPMRIARLSCTPSSRRRASGRACAPTGRPCLQDPKPTSAPGWSPLARRFTCMRGASSPPFSPVRRCATLLTP